MNKKEILILEDNSDWNTTHNANLKYIGNIKPFQLGNQALEYIKKDSSRNIGVAIIDKTLYYPGTNERQDVQGEAVAKHIKNNRKDIVLIMVTEAPITETNSDYVKGSKLKKELEEFSDKVFDKFELSENYDQLIEYIKKSNKDKKRAIDSKPAFFIEPTNRFIYYVPEKIKKNLTVEAIKDVQSQNYQKLLKHCNKLKIGVNTSYYKLFKVIAKKYLEGAHNNLLLLKKKEIGDAIWGEDGYNKRLNHIINGLEKKVSENHAEDANTSEDEDADYINLKLLEEGKAKTKKYNISQTLKLEAEKTLSEPIRVCLSKFRKKLNEQTEGRISEKCFEYSDDFGAWKVNFIVYDPGLETAIDQTNKFRWKFNKDEPDETETNEEDGTED